jgi:ornithine cyclodeaminase/alanine dehydrogenase-like protein (mu-crystallin family)
MTARLGIEVTAANAPEEAAENQDIVITATTAREPVLFGKWLAPGAFVAAVGSNMLMKREIDDETITRCSLIIVDSIEQSKIEAGDLLPPFERRLFRWEQVVELKDIVAGTHTGRTDNAQVIVFKSNGLALEDVAVATVVYQKARQTGIGVSLPF